MLDESIFKAYDIRGVYPESLDEGVATDMGRAFVKYLDLSGSRVVVARDMRISGEALEKAFIQGVTQAGADVLDRCALLRRRAPRGARRGHGNSFAQPQRLQRLQALQRGSHRPLGRRRARP